MIPWCESCEQGLFQLVQTKTWQSPHTNTAILSIMTSMQIRSTESNCFWWIKIQSRNCKLLAAIYKRRDRITVSKKSADFTDFWTPIRCVQCLKLKRYMHCTACHQITRHMHWYQCMCHYLMTYISLLDDTQCVYLIRIPEPMIYIYTDFPLIWDLKVVHYYNQKQSSCKKSVQPWKICEIQSGSQEMAVIVG